MRPEEAEKFCQIAQELGLIKPEQRSAFLAQSVKGIHNPTAYFLLQGMLQPDQADRVLDELATGIRGATKIMKMEDTVLVMRPASTPAEAVPEPAPAPAEEVEVLPDESGSSGILNMDDTALQLAALVLEAQRAESGELPAGVLPPSKPFVRVAIRRGDITGPQVQEYIAQTSTGFQDAATFFLLSGILLPEQIDRIGEEVAREGSGNPLLQGAEESVLRMKRVEAEIPPEPCLPVFLGRYTALGELGRGDLGIVYKAHDTVNNRPVAVKVFTGGGLTPAELTRFMKDVRLAGRLAHPNLVSVLDTRSEGDQHFIIMEFIDGVALDEFAAARPCTGSRRDRATAEVLRTLVQVANALQSAHERKILHRGLKPRNVLVERGGLAKVTDFGLAKDTGALATSGASAALPHYMSPEQAQGDARNLDARSDVYSFAALLYFCVCGIAPFEGGAIHEILQKVVTGEAVRPLRIRPEMDRELEMVILKGLRKEKSRRYGSMREIADDLRRFARGERILA